MSENDDIEILRHKYIALRGLQKIAIVSITDLEEKNLILTNENIELKKTVQTLSASNATVNMLMINALTNNNKMKDEYRLRIQTLEEQLKNKE
jgi:hypothetical protein